MAGSSQLVKELREKTGAGILDCQKALTENGDDMRKPSITCAKKAWPLR